MTLPLGSNKLFYLNNGKGPISGSRNPSSKSLDIKLWELKRARGLILSTIVKLWGRIHSEIFNSVLQLILKKKVWDLWCQPFYVIFSLSSFSNRCPWNHLVKVAATTAWNMCIIYLIDLEGEHATMKDHPAKILTIFNTCSLGCYFLWKYHYNIH